MPVSRAVLALLALGVAACAWASGPLEEAYRLMAHGEYKEALAKLDAALAEGPTDLSEMTGEQRERTAEILFLMGRGREQLEDYDAALATYSNVTSMFPESASYAGACLALAQLHIRHSEPEKAAAELEKALARGLSAEHEFRAKVFLAEALSIPGTSIQDLERALKLYGELEEKAIRPADVARITYGLGFSFQQKDDWQRAEEYYVAVSQMAPDSLWSAYARMQRITHYRTQQFGKDVALLQKQLRRQHLELRDFVQAGPLAPDLLEAAPMDVKMDGKPIAEIRLPQDAVFTHNGYTVRAGQFVMRQPEQTLIGRQNVTLQHRSQRKAGMQIRAATVSIDLRRRSASFSGDVVFESLPNDPNATPEKIGDFAGIVVNLDTGWLRFRFAEHPH
ncbi:MAG: tetratricopeptide repeat protein [Verrucomicrobia bacterium]|nr:tetratricopeptide repeat protein [Verrucomicrobiota bacterium]